MDPCCCLPLALSPFAPAWVLWLDLGPGLSLAVFEAVGGPFLGHCLRQGHPWLPTALSVKRGQPLLLPAQETAARTQKLLMAVPFTQMAAMGGSANSPKERKGWAFYTDLSHKITKLLELCVEVIKVSFLMLSSLRNRSGKHLNLLSSLEEKKPLWLG